MDDSSQAQTSGARRQPPPAYAAPQASPVPTQADSGYIILQPGETLSYISALYAVSEKNLIDWNGLNSAHDVRAGQRLAIRPTGIQRAPLAAQTEAAPDGGIIVASGQTLSGIAHQYGVTVAQLREWNGLTSDALRVGQHLRVQPPHARANGSIGAPAAEKRMAERRQQETAHGATPDAPDADGMITVQSGQSLSLIAARYKVGTADLRQWNRLKNDQIQIGQHLRVRAPVRIHTVKYGESLGGIAARYKVNARSLMQRNRLADADMLPVGKELIIP